MRFQDFARCTMTLLCAAAAACGSAASDVCELVCECTHCNDFQEEQSCAQLEWQADVAEAYDCTSEFEEWAGCVEDNGTCNEDEASFSTRERGSCSATADSNFDCSLDPDVCSTFGNGATCEDGTCRYRACAGAPGPNPPACNSDGECPFGPDRCAEAHEALVQCQDDASDVNPLLQNPQPEPGGSSGGVD